MQKAQYETRELKAALREFSRENWFLLPLAFSSSIEHTVYQARSNTQLTHQEED